VSVCSYYRILTHTHIHTTQRFELKYADVEGENKQVVYNRPVMIHRAILGSVERMFAVLCEHTGEDV
jgi:threonyl-tRNA synthetase